MLINRNTEKKQRHGSVHQSQFEIYTISVFLSGFCNEDCCTMNGNLYAMIWVDRGVGHMIIDIEKYAVQTGVIYYIKPGQVFGLELDESAEGYIILFQREFFELYDRKTAELINSPLFNYYLQKPAITIDQEIIDSVRGLIVEMLHAFSTNFELRLEILKGLLKVIIIYLGRCVDNGQGFDFQTRKKDLVSSFFVLLEKNYATKKQVKEYAENLAVTPNYLNDIVKEISGVTAGSHIQRRVILEAKRRAVFEGNTLKEIAYHLGFMDPSHFSKYFKNSSGVNFTDFKKGVSKFQTQTCH